jgi:hypothetical protein
MRFLLGTSVFDGGKPERQAMTQLWIENIERMDVKPTKVVMIGEGGANIPALCGDAVRLSGDLGHIHQHLDDGPKSHHGFTGWSASMLALAMLAYVDEADFIYKESDCVAFGPWVQALYRDCGNADWVFGPKMQSAPWMACAQSLFMVRHKAIPQFVMMFLQRGPENSRHMIGENRFVDMAGFYYPHEFNPALRTAYLSFGVDRERPIPWDAPVFYFQQPTAAELASARKRNLI